MTPRLRWHVVRTQTRYALICPFCTKRAYVSDQRCRAMYKLNAPLWCRSCVHVAPISWKGYSDRDGFRLANDGHLLTIKRGGGQWDLASVDGSKSSLMSKATTRKLGGLGTYGVYHRRPQ